MIAATDSSLLNPVRLTFPYDNYNAAEAVCDASQSVINLAIFIGAPPDVRSPLALVRRVVPDAFLAFESLSTDDACRGNFSTVLGAVRKLILLVAARPGHFRHCPRIRAIPLFKQHFVLVSLALCVRY